MQRCIGAQFNHLTDKIMSLFSFTTGDNKVDKLKYVAYYGTYSADATYPPFAVVKHNDIAYLQNSTVAIKGIAPTDTNYWIVWTAAEAASTVAWSNITGKPTTFNAGTLQSVTLSAATPTANQFLRYSSGSSSWVPTTYAPDWSEIASKPASFTPASHVHSADDITSGTLGAARIPDLDAAKITAGSLVVARGGTGLSALGSSHAILSVNTAGSAMEYRSLTAGAGITITPATGSFTIASTATGTVTSVGLTVPNIFTVSGSAVTTSGNVGFTLASQGTGNQVFASPDGASGAPGFRSIVAADIPSLDAAKIGSGTLPIARGGTGQVTANAAINALVPSQTGNSGKVLSTDGTNTSWVPAGGTGTVTSVGIGGTNIFSYSSAVTASGTLTLNLADQVQSKVLAAPSGATGTPTFRLLVAGDLPSHAHVKADISDFAHTHDDRYFTETELTTSGGGGSVHYNNITSKPAQYDANTLQTRALLSTAPSTGQVITWNGTAWAPATPTGTGDMLQSVYDTDGLAPSPTYVDAARVAPWSGITDKPSSFTPASHTHPSSAITDFTVAAQDAAGALVNGSGGVAGTSATLILVYNSGSATLKGTVRVDGTTITAGASSISAANTTAQWNANQFQGRAFASTAPTSGQAIVWDSSGGGTWKPASIVDPSPAFVTLTDGPTVTLDVTGIKVSNATVTLGGARTLAITGAASGSQGVIKVVQDGTGGRTLSLPATSKVVNSGSGAWTPTAAAGSTDILAWIYDGANYFWTIGKTYS